MFAFPCAVCVVKYSRRVFTAPRQPRARCGPACQLWMAGPGGSSVVRPWSAGTPGRPRLAGPGIRRPAKRRGWDHQGLPLLAEALLAACPGGTPFSRGGASLSWTPVRDRRPRSSPERAHPPMAGGSGVRRSGHREGSGPPWPPGREEGGWCPPGRFWTLAFKPCVFSKRILAGGSGPLSGACLGDGCAFLPLRACPGDRGLGRAHRTHVSASGLSLTGEPGPVSPRRSAGVVCAGAGSVPADPPQVLQVKEANEYPSGLPISEGLALSEGWGAGCRLGALRLGAGCRLWGCSGWGGVQAGGGADSGRSGWGRGADWAGMALRLAVTLTHLCHVHPFLKHILKIHFREEGRGGDGWTHHC